MRSLLLTAIVLSTFSSIFTYNISPVPNQILKLRNISEETQSRSSYFGFSLNLRKTHIMIGAPRANSTFENLSDIKEPGQVYKCTFDGSCEEFKMGQERNLKERLKSEQLFGFSMDGFETENDKFVACAPRHALVGEIDYFMIGFCYYVKNTINNSGNESLAIEPLNQPKNYFIDKRLVGIKSQYNERASSKSNEVPYYIYGESGFSAHIPNDKSEVVIGSPGVLIALGTVSKYNFASLKNTIGDVTIWDFKQNHFLSEDSNFGYALTSGQFFYPDKTLIYVASAPRRNTDEKNNGIVLFFEIAQKQKDKKKKEMTPYNKIYDQIGGPQMGSGFGYALLCDDFNNDGKPDLVISAPFYGIGGSYDNGMVYVYINQGSSKKKLNFNKPLTLSLDNLKGGEKFGIALGKIGDINGDGYNDLAISSVSDGMGRILIYFGSKDGLKLAQEIKMSNSNSMFGFSLSRGVDIDENGFYDFAVGAPNEEIVYIYKSYPVINVKAQLKPSKNQIELSDSINVSTCLEVVPKYKLNFDVEFEIELKIDTRASFLNESEKTLTFKMNVSEQTMHCETFELKVDIKVNKTSISSLNIKPLNIKMSYNVTKKISQNESEFCEDCVFLNRAILNSATLEVPVATGCSNGSCKPNLILKGALMETDQKFIIGLTKTLSIFYSISNLGESAYFPKLEIEIPTAIKFTTLPSSCKAFNSETKIICKVESVALKNNQNSTFNITLDVSNVREREVEILARVSSSGDEVDDSNNMNSIQVTFDEESDVEIEGQFSDAYFILQKNDEETREITYIYKIINYGPSPIRVFDLDVFVPHFYTKSKKLKLIKLKSVECVYKNLYINLKRNIIEHIANDDLKSLEIFNNESVTVDCGRNNIECLTTNATILNFEPSQENPIEVIIKFKIIKKSMDEILNKAKVKFLTFSPTLQSKSQNGSIIDLGIIIKKDTIKETPLWIWIVSILGGFIFLFLVVWTLAKLGFFKRKIKEELVKIKRETLMFPIAVAIGEEQAHLSPN